MTIKIKVEGLIHKYPDGTRALMGANLDVREGEFLAILGANGSGKTTLLKHLNGLLKPVSGSVILDSKTLSAFKPSEVFRKVGMVFQDPNDQLIAPTVEEDVAFGPTNLNLGYDEIMSRVNNALELVKMKEFAKKAIHALSYGQSKRICIAGILAMQPEVIILDEPTSGLDPDGVKTIMKILNDLNKKQGITIIFATNSVDLVPVHMDRVAIMDKGIVVQEGTPERIFTDSKKLEGLKLELPLIAQLMEVLRDKEKLPINSLPLTIGQAKHELSHLFNRENNIQHAGSIE
ncbi:MAG: ATP-binding cassette domain-containing protein [Candidatus Scalindua sp. AMX11]|nr:MAG: ATP-binding cassette domain-containing protein [Candidatus Scalindua sp.]NOG84468.1 ATP-binding cassette domain-containing protein [Planctomycetota bacterium]RZV80520.1 MAG: ATP-binding cassette domain-containing protein [Candidatus Scalindua sp. SCAELEC01]TDE65262.1 MAG: ATP-binding cassette domain-containing protein [Candidatus Scalindua sp. AMX11]GJQ58469.1 MAG: putative ABC transporter ATP-binding protein [Candidatus Scalindua sp.]